ncbi:MAG TPA: glycosyltransferase [Steroidobacteraceae bacterium]|jgi:hypothetical protein
MRFMVVDTWAKHATVERIGAHEVRYFSPLRYLGREMLATYPTADHIVSLHRRGNAALQAMLAEFLRAGSDFGAEGMVAHLNFFPPEWLVEHCDGFVRALGCIDDPHKTYSATLPAVWAYHGAYYCSPSYSATKRFADALATFGVTHTHWFPLSFTRPTAELVSAVEASWSARRPHALYVGKCYGDKVDKLARLDRGIGRRLNIYGKDWPLAGLAGFLAPLRGRAFMPKWVRPVDEQQRRQLYLSSLIGFNTHWGTGEETGNMRMYEVPMHGAMLLADKAGCDAHADIFEPDVEAVYYGSVEEAIDKCRYYFRHPQEAIAIAQRGFARARRDYAPEKVLGELLDWAATLNRKARFATAPPPG